MFRQVVQEMVQKGGLTVTSNYIPLRDLHIAGDFRFIVMENISPMRIR